ncbi:MAG: hypothetical protein U1E97_10485 [Alphaproteobacteria bacterium]
MSGQRLATVGGEARAMLFADGPQMGGTLPGRGTVGFRIWLKAAPPCARRLAETVDLVGRCERGAR